MLMEEDWVVKQVIGNRYGKVMGVEFISGFLPNKTKEEAVKLYNEKCLPTIKGCDKPVNQDTRDRRISKLDAKGKVLETYANATIAAKRNGVYSSGISSVLRGIRKTCGGYGWKRGV